MTTRRKSAVPRTKTLAIKRKAAQQAIIEAERVAEFERGYDLGKKYGEAEAIVKLEPKIRRAVVQEYVNLLLRRQLTHEESANWKFIFKGSDRIRADECSEVRRLIMSEETDPTETEEQDGASENGGEQVPDPPTTDPVIPADPGESPGGPAPHDGNG